MAQLDSWALFIDFVKAFDTVPREMPLLVKFGVERLGFPPKIVNLVRLLHEKVSLEVIVDGETITINYNIGVKQGDTLAPSLFLCYIQAVMETPLPQCPNSEPEASVYRRS